MSYHAECENCGKGFAEYSGYRGKRKRHYCSTSCRFKLYRTEERAKAIKLALDNDELWRLDKMSIRDIKKCGYKVTVEL